MRVLFHESKSSIFDGYINVCISRQDSVIIWHPDVKPTFDLFYETNPEFVFLEAENLTSGLIRCLEQYNPKVYIFVDAFSTLKNEKYVKYAHILNRKLVSSSKNLNVTYLSIYNKTLLDRWKELEISVESVGIGVDNLLYSEPTPRPEYIADISILEDNPGLDDVIFDWLSQGLKVKLYGKGWNKFPEGVGLIDRRELANIIVSSKNVECFNPYTGIEQLKLYTQGQKDSVQTYSQILDKIL